MMNRRKQTQNSLFLFAALSGIVSIGTAARAQSSPVKPTAKPGAKPTGLLRGAMTSDLAPGIGGAREITLTFARPGTYDYWTVGKSGAGAVETAPVGAKTATVIFPPDTTAIEVLASDSGLVATLDATKVASAAATISPNDFTRLHTVKVAVTAGGKPVEKAQVTLTDASGRSASKALTSDDAGIATFNDVSIGKATVAAAYGAGGAKTASDVTLAPAKGGGALTIPLALSGDVPTLAASPSASAPAPVVVAAPVAAESPAPGSTGNAWLPGVFGVMLLVIGLYYGLRTAKKRGMTVEGALKQIGVETPATAPNAPGAGLKPAPAPLPPLPALSDLPAAGPASTSPNVFAVAGVASVGPARLQGLAGAVTGETFDLDPGEPLTIGRDVGNGLALAQDTAISRRHVRIGKSATGWEITDEGSSNGTFVNGKRLAAGAAQFLQPGDEIQAGGARFRFEGS